MNDNKKIKSDLWDVYYKLQEAGASKVVKYAIIDVMILMDKEAEKNSDLLDSALDICSSSFSFAALIPASLTSNASS